MASLLNGICDPAPGIGTVVITVSRELVDAGAALLEDAEQHLVPGPSPDLHVAGRALRTGQGRQEG